MFKLYRFQTAVLGLLFVLMMAGCAHSPPSNPSDPLESVNRFNFKVNNQIDKFVLRPVAVGYNKVVPDRVQASVSNFFDNASQPVTMVNSLLQLKWGKFNQSLGRFMINTSFGIGGLFDVASDLNVPHPDEDFGQTLGYYGVGPGFYLYLPLLGPSDVRDFLGNIADQSVSPISYLGQFDEIEDNYFWLPYALRALQGINLRASLLGFDQTLKEQFDPYAFVRSYYLEERLKKVYDGDVPAKLQSDGVDDSGADYPSAAPAPAGLGAP